MSEVSIHDTIMIGKDVVFRELGGEAVILNLETGIYFGLNEVGTRVWQLAGEDGSLAKICSILADEYDVAAPVLERDVLQLVGELCAKGLMRVP